MPPKKKPTPEPVAVPNEPRYRLRVWRVTPGESVPVIDRYMDRYDLNHWSHVFYMLLGNAINTKPGLHLETTGKVPFIALVEQH